MSSTYLHSEDTSTEAGFGYSSNQNQHLSILWVPSTKSDLSLPVMAGSGPKPGDGLTARNMAGKGFRPGHDHPRGLFQRAAVSSGVWFAATSDLYSQVLLVPFVSIYLARLNRRNIGGLSEANRRFTAFAWSAGSVVLGGQTGWRFGPVEAP